MRCQGRVASWKDDRGFGFIAPDDGGELVFVHISSFTNRQRRPAGDELVAYDLATDGHGRLQAKAVSFVGDGAAPVSRPGRTNFPLLFAACFLLSVCTAVLTGWLPLEVLVIYIAASLITFFAYALDKSSAVRRQRRTAESTLHLFAILGGWPGAVAAQHFLRHKSSKRSFQVAFWVTVMLNCTAVTWLVSSSGAELLRAVLPTSWKLFR
jgi:uncharacterized membrane protein YsdA (DUF1294 family)/cold shock CspA family protein